MAAPLVGKALASPGMKVKKSKIPLFAKLLLPLFAIGGLLFGLKALKNRRKPKLVKGKPAVVVPPKPAVAPVPVPVAPAPAQPVVATRFPLLRKIKKTKKTYIPEAEVIQAGPHPTVVRQAGPVRHQVRTQYIPPPVQHAEYVEEVPVIKKKRFGRIL